MQKNSVKIFISFAFKVIEDTYHGTPSHNVYNCFNNGHNVSFFLFDGHNIDTFAKKFKNQSNFFSGPNFAA